MRVLVKLNFNGVYRAFQNSVFFKGTKKKKQIYHLKKDDSWILRESSFLSSLATMSIVGAYCGWGHKDDKNRNEDKPDTFYYGKKYSN
ncbi:MAG: hypothetical protein H6Q70_2501 [Firmicutes bacterium]|nr:hypothetical protein [Bacillota bacterium]